MIKKTITLGLATAVVVGISLFAQPAKACDNGNDFTSYNPGYYGNGYGFDGFRRHHRWGGLAQYVPYGNYNYNAYADYNPYLGNAYSPYANIYGNYGNGYGYVNGYYPYANGLYNTYGNYGVSSLVGRVLSHF